MSGQARVSPTVASGCVPPRLRALVVERLLGYHQGLLRPDYSTTKFGKGIKVLNLKTHSRDRSNVRSTLLLRLCFSFVVVLVSASALPAQTNDTASLRGQVVDPNKAAVVNAKVVVTNELTGFSREGETDGEGRYTIAGLPLTGKYRLSVTYSGFAPLRLTDIELRAGEAATFDVTLIASCIDCGSEVTVYGTTEGLQTDTPQLGTRLDLEKIDNTPIQGRKITSLVELNSAVRPARGTGDLFVNSFLFVVNGSGRRQTTITLDGSTADDAWGRQTIFTSIPLSTIQEFTILTNAASAEYGHTTGSAINIVTKSGTNDLHADLVGVARPGGLEAAAPLATRRTIDRLAQLSGVASGPLRRDQTYLLVGGEINVQHRDAIVTSRIAPNSVFAGIFQQSLAFARLDHKINNKNILTGRLNLDRFRDTNPADAVGGLALPSAARTFSRRTYAGQLSDTTTFNGSLFNEARLQMQVGSPITRFDPIQFSTQFVRTGISTEGESRAPVLINHQYQAADTLSLTRGKHFLKLGGDALYSTSGGNGQEFGTGFVLGQFTFPANVSGCTATSCVPTSQLTLGPGVRYQQSFGNANYRVGEWLWSTFAQDDWLVTRDLTLNLGLRYERQTFTDDTNNFAPRVGFAYNFLGDGKTVLRGSYGIYYSQLRSNLGASFNINGPGGIFSFTANFGQLGFPTTLAPLSAFPPGAPLPARDVTIRPGRAALYAQFGIDTSRLRGYPDKLLNPYTQQGTVGIQRELPGKWFLNVDYVWAHTIKIDRTLDLNGPSLFIPTAPGQTRSAAAADLTRPIRPVNNGYRRILVVVNSGDSLYNGMQVNLTKRLAHNFSMLASYTWSHTINTVEFDAPQQDPADINLVGKAERADSLLDQRQRLVVSGWYNLPYHFTFGGVTSAASGRPYAITAGVDTNGDNSNADRPFDLASQTFLGRNAGQGTPVYSTDLFLQRTFTFEHVGLELRAEGFNIFNHNNIVGRNGTYGSSTIGAHNATLGAPLPGIANVDPGRQFQFQLRLRY
jgi:hypothetical protein